jgi:hypothetical protein
MQLQEPPSMLEFKMLLTKLSQLYVKKSVKTSMTSKLEEKRSTYKRLKTSKPGIEHKRKRFKSSKTRMVLKGLLSRTYASNWRRRIRKSIGATSV